MKLICLAVSTVVCALFAYSQSPPKPSLKEIIAGATTEFQSFKGRLKSAGKMDSVYYSTSVLEGSKEAEIESITDRMVQYHAYLADSATKKEAEKLVKKWKDKIAVSVPDYKLSTIDNTIGHRKTKGYAFSKLDNAFSSISIVYSKKEIDEFYWVLLSVTQGIKKTTASSQGNEK